MQFWDQATRNPDRRVQPIGNRERRVQSMEVFRERPPFSDALDEETYTQEPSVGIERAINLPDVVPVDHRRGSSGDPQSLLILIQREIEHHTEGWGEYEVHDHGELDGLGDDDHTQYHTDARGDARYYTETELDAGQLDDRYYTETELDAGQLDNRYYTEAELDAGQLDNRYFRENEFIDTSAGAGDAGKPIVLDAGGHVDASMLNAGDLDHGSLGGLGDDDHTIYVKGPGSATDNAITRYDDTTGKLVQDSSLKVDDSGFLEAPNPFAVWYGHVGTPLLVLGDAGDNRYNYLKVSNAVSGVGPTVEATGGSTNVDLLLVSKGTGEVKANGEVVGIKGEVEISLVAAGAEFSF